MKCLLALFGIPSRLSCKMGPKTDSTQVRFFVVFPSSPCGIVGHTKISHNGFLSLFIHNIIYSHSIPYKVPSCKRLLLPSVSAATVCNSCSSRQFAVQCPTDSHSPLSPLTFPYIFLSVQTSFASEDFSFTFCLQSN